MLMQHLELASIANKTNCLTTVTKDNLLLQRPRGRKPGTIYIDKSPTLTQTAWEQNNLIMETPISQIIQMNPSTESNGKQPYQQNRVYSSEGKAPALMEGSGGRTINVIPPPATCTRIRRLTPAECARLQTIPEWYKWVVSETQQYRMLGNGWTVEVIAHILQFLPESMK